ncbi:MAG: hypothetical protein ACRENE_04850 [Polyangiaceae bacterium]
MPKLKAAVSIASCLAALVAAPAAFAAGMDPTPERLIYEPAGIPTPPAGTMGPACYYLAAHPGYMAPPSGTIPAFPCQPANNAWANMMSELGMAIAPPAFHPARTTGLSGFALSFETNITRINQDASVTEPDKSTIQYWHLGTQGSVDPNTKAYSIRNNQPDAVLQVYSVKARKGLAYGFEITGALGYVANTSLWVGGGDVHWSILEGFRTGLFGYLPDIAVGGGVRTLGGSPKFFLTTVGIDAQISKPFTLADSAVLTPYVGGQRVIIFANSTVVNLAPQTDPLAVCGYEGNNVPGNPKATGAPFKGEPVCANQASSPAAPNTFNNLSVFDKAVDHRWRGIVGVDYRYEVLYLAAQFAMDITDPAAENHNLGIVGDKQWTLSLETGVFF